MQYDPNRIPARTRRAPVRQTDAHEAIRQTTTQAPVPTTSQVSRAVRIDEDDYPVTRVPRSALRYTDQDGNQVIRNGNRQLVIHPAYAPRRRNHVHWSFWIGLGMLTMLLFWVGAQWIGAAWQNHTLDAQYGMPRTFQIDAVVGHEDSPAHPSHFTFENLHGHVLVIEIPGGDDLAHARIYNGGQVTSDQVPITGSFRDMNGDGRPDMILQVGEQTIIFLNTGTVFVSQP